MKEKLVSNLYQLFLVLFLIKTCNSDVDFDDISLEELMIDFNKDTSHYRDPHDMFASSNIDEKKADYALRSNSLPTGGCNVHSLENKCSKELKSCSSKISELDTQLKSEQTLSLTLQKQILGENKVDVLAFYTRIIKKFWALLEMESLEQFLKTEDETFIRHFICEVNAADIEAFKDFFHGKNVNVQIDSFFENNIYKDTKYEFESTFSILQENVLLFFSQFKNFEVMLATLWVLLYALCFWVTFLFIRNMQREFRWRQALLMGLMIFFVISCIVHWKHMIKMKEVKRHSYLMEQDENQAKTQCAGSASFWTFVKRFLNMKTDCENYYEMVMISPEEEISPMMAVFETFSSFIFLPLKHFGQNMGSFMFGFYNEIPLLWHIPATMLLLVLLLIFMLTLFGYGLHFPFWMGGIYPAGPKNGNNETARLIKESEDKMIATNKKLIEEAKVMITQITQAALLSQQQESVSLQPMVNRSGSLIEQKLETLIDTKFSLYLEQREAMLRGRSSLADDTKPFLKDQNTVVMLSKCHKSFGALLKDKVDSTTPTKITSEPFQHMSLIKRVRECAQAASEDAETIDNEDYSVQVQSCTSELMESSESPFLTEVKNMFDDIARQRGGKNHVHSEAVET